MPNPNYDKLSHENNKSKTSYIPGLPYKSLIIIGLLLYCFILYKENREFTIKVNKLTINEKNQDLLDKETNKFYSQLTIVLKEEINKISENDKKTYKKLNSDSFTNGIFNLFFTLDDAINLYVNMYKICTIKNIQKQIIENNYDLGNLIQIKKYFKQPFVESFLLELIKFIKK